MPTPASACFLLAFSTTTDGYAARMHLRGRFPVTVMPTPRAVTAGCGVSLRVREEDFAQICGALRELGISGSRLILYRAEFSQGNLRVLERVELP